MKSLLVGINAKYIHPSLAIYQLMKNTDIESKVLEFTIKETDSKIIEKIIEKIDDVFLIGFSCYLWNINKVLKISSFIKENFPNIKIFLGGPEVGFDAEYYLNSYKHIDYICCGEGENCFNQICHSLLENTNINEVENLVYRENNQIVKNKQVAPNLSKIKLATLDVKDLENRIVYLESGRGCPYSCSYCTASLDNHVRFFPLDKIISIIDELIKRKVKTVKFLDRTFNSNMKYMIDILEHIDNNNISTVFQFEIVAEKFSQEAINKIANLKSKFLRFEIGIQSIHEDVNKAVFRNQNMDKLEKNLLLLNNTNKVDLHVDLIAGLPYETKIRFIQSFNKVFYYKVKELQLGFLKFLKGTKLLNSVDEFEYVYDNNPPYEIIKNKFLSEADLSEIHVVEDALEHFYNSGKFKSTFDYLIDNKLIESPYMFFLSIGQQISYSSLEHNALFLDSFLSKTFEKEKDILHFLLIKDYLEDHLTKPKIWWNYKQNYKRETLYKKISAFLNLNVETLYRYGFVYLDEAVSKIFLIIYKDFKPTSYLIDLKNIL